MVSIGSDTADWEWKRFGVVAAAAVDKWHPLNTHAFENKPFL